MISGIGAFSAVSLTGLAQSANADGQRSKQGDSGSRGSTSFAPILANTDATGLTVSAEQRKIIQELRQRARDMRGTEQTAGSQSAQRATTAKSQQALRGYARATESLTPPPEEARAEMLTPARVPAQELSFVATATATATQAQSKMERAAAAYKRMGGETGLAPFGTGISLAV